jgi:hypothetical protein
MNQVRLGYAVLGALVVLALSACATMKVSSFPERGADFARYRTFAWGPADKKSTGDPRLDNNRFFHERVRAGVERQLAAKGFEKTTSSRADLVLHYHLSIAQRVDVSGIDREYGYCETGDCRPEVYDAGTLVIDLIDRRAGKLAWRGWAESAWEGVIDQQDWLEAKVDEVVARILERVPGRM